MSENPSCDNTLHKTLYYLVGNFYYYLFIIGFMVRFYRHRNIGKYNLKSPKPKTYLYKIFFQSVMVAISFGMIYDLDCNG